MNYVAPKSVQLDRRVEIFDVMDFFVSYIQNDRLGLIANAHIVHADKQPGGIFSKECLLLAELHSVAVDFAKSGLPAVLPRDIMPQSVQDQYPDYMGKHRDISYASDSVLGKLYRECLGSSSSSFGRRKFEDAGCSKPIDVIVDAVADNGEFDEEAKTLLASWNSRILRLLNEFGVKSEGEILSGQVDSFGAHHSQLRGRREHGALLMRLNRRALDMKSEFREIFWHDVGTQGSPDSNLSPEAIQKACAWYKACSRQVKKDRDEGRFAILSFPWCVSEVLCKIVSAHLGTEITFG